MIEQENQNIGYLHLTNISNKVPLRVNKVQYKNLIPDDIRDQYSDYIDYDINLINTTTCTDGQYLGKTYNGDTEEWEYGIYEDSNYSITDYIAIDPVENQYGFYGLLEPDYDDPAYDHWYDANVEVYNSSKVRIDTMGVSSFGTWINDIFNSEEVAYVRISFITAQKNNIRLCKVGTPNNYVETIDYMLDDNYPITTDETSSWRASTTYAIRYCNDNMFGSNATCWEHEYPYSKHATSYSGLLSDNLWKKQFTEIQDQDLESLNIKEFLKENSLKYIINDSDNSILTYNYSDEYKTTLVYSSTIAFPAGEYWFSSDINAGFLIYNSDTGVEEFIPFDEFNSSIEIYSLNDINNGPEVLLGKIDKNNKKINFSLSGEDRLNIYFKFYENSIPSAEYEGLSTALKINMSKTMLSRTDKDYVVAVSKAEAITPDTVIVGGNERYPIIHNFINDKITDKQYETTPGFVHTYLYRLNFQLDEEYTNDILYVWKCTPSQKVRENEQIYCNYPRYVETIDSNMNYEFISNMDGIIRIGLFKTRTLSEDPDIAFENYGIKYGDIDYPVEEYTTEDAIENYYFVYSPLTAPVILKHGNEANIFLMRCSHYYMQAECLSEDTLINTEAGLLPISKLKEGNKILVKNKFNKYVYQPVERVIRYKTEKINMIAIATENGIIKSTENHEFFTDRGILPASKLKEDYHLIDKDNNLIPIKRITKFYYSNSITYDLVVKDNNYFVGKNKIHVKSTQNYNDYQKERRK